MKNGRSRDTLVAITLVVIMTLITIIAVAQQVRATTVDPPLSTLSNDANGAAALFRWLTALGYGATNNVGESFAIPEESDIVFILEPTEPITAVEWEQLDHWIAEGGTLILAGDDFTSLQAFEHFEVVLRVLFVEGTPTVDTPLTQQPVIPPLPVQDRVRYLDSSRTDMVPLLSINGLPIMLTFSQGEGRVILTTLTEPFSNFGLQQPAHAELLLNLFGEPGQRVWFDEWHHGERPSQVVSSNWLQRTPFGRAILYTAVVLFIWLLLRGQNFGRPVPLQKDIVRRSPLEFVTAVANLSRRAGHRQAVLQDSHDRLKRRLAARYRLSPALPDDEFVAKLGSYHPTLDEAALGDLLRRLRQTAVSEAELVQLVQEATNFEL